MSASTWSGAFRRGLLAISGVIFAGFTGVGSAHANDTQGWYLGLGVGYDHMNNVNEAVPLSAHVDLSQQDGVLVAGSFGYKWASNLRMEFEVGYEHHDISAPFTGHTSMVPIDVNVLYDWNLGNNFILSAGVGVGPGSFTYCSAPSGSPCTGATLTGINGQLIGEISFPIQPNLYGYVMGFERTFLSGSGDVKQVTDQGAMLGIRWFVGNPPPAQKLR
jgi:hypothetical protein